MSDRGGNRGFAQINADTVKTIYPCQFEGSASRKGKAFAFYPWLSALIRGLLILFSFTALPVSADAQCSMCYSNAAQADVHQRTALRRGILVLGIPAALMICGVALAAYRSGKNEDDESDEL